MEVDYFHLAGGYTLQKGDTLKIYGINHTVASCSDKYYLRNDTGLNDRVFKLFGLSPTEVDKWAEKYGISVKRCVFPEFDSLKNLTNFVKAIYEKPLYKIGDKVCIKERTERATAYPFTFIDEMAKHKGKVYEISQVEIMSSTTYRDSKLTQGDVHKYYLKGTSYLWHSSMFALYESAPVSGKPVQIERPSDNPPDNSQQETTDNQIIIKSKQIIKTIIKL